MTFRNPGLLAAIVLCLTAQTAPAQSAKDIVAALREKAFREGWTFRVSEAAGGGYGVLDQCGLVVPKDWRQRAPWQRFDAKAALPEKLDLRPYCTPIRDQGACGSCWAFGTVGVLEAVLILKTGISTDLSEQWLVSCNQEEAEPGLLGEGTWGCNGGWFAHDYHQWKTDPCGGYGAVLESRFHYVHEDAPCACPYVHSYWIDGWAYIGDDESIPPVNEIKQAMLEYGPISVGVTVIEPFRFYHDGVVESTTAEEVNHAVVLVGWDDTLGVNGAWILRNSWGTEWGMDGYMYIGYGALNVGFGACFVQYPAAPGLPGPVITVDPHPRIVSAGNPVTFRVSANGVGGLHYQWFKDGAPIGDDAPELTLENVTDTAAGNYTCQVSDLRGTTRSQPAQLLVREAGALPVAHGPGILCLVAATLLLARAAIRKHPPLRVRSKP